MQALFTRESLIVPFEHSLKTNFNSDPVDLKLSDAQRDIFKGWRRPIHIFGWPPDDQHHTASQDPAFLMAASREIDLVQDITSDCSVVASLCASTARALKGHGKVTMLSSTPNFLI